MYGKSGIKQHSDPTEKSGGHLTPDPHSSAAYALMQLTFSVLYTAIFVCFAFDVTLSILLDCITPRGC